MHTTALTTRLAALALALTSLNPALRADADYHAPFAPFSVTVHDSSTLFNSDVGFNGGMAAFKGLGGLQGTDGNGPTSASLSGVVVATFVADPGYVFNSVFLSFGQWSYSNAPFYGGHGHTGSWSLPGGVYSGGTNPPENSGPYSEAWTGSGSSGTFSRQDFQWWSGGGNSGLGLMDGPILLNDVTSFTLTFDLTMYVTNTSYYSISSFDVHTVTAGAPPPANEVPEGPLPPALFAGVIAAILLLGTRRRPHLHGATR